MEIFKCIIDLDRFPIKKNSKEIFMNRSTGKRFISTNNKAKVLIDKLNAKLLTEKLKQRIDTINYDVNIQMQFFFPKSVYFTKQGKRSSKVADLSNLYQAIEDSLQKVGILQNDSLICSHDGSGRYPIEDSYKLKIVITRKVQDGL